jgi:geranylgeranyl diphosphate synthase, type I
MLTEPENFPSAQGFPAILTDARRLSEPLLQDSVRRLHPMLAEMTEYHLGWRQASGAANHAAGGKGVCLALPLLAAGAVSADADVAVPGAVAVELVHIFTHMHDDIMDGDSRRRHRETLWKVYGVGPAILAGDAVFALAMDVVARAPRGPAAVRNLLDSCLKIAAGQALDLEFESRPLEGPGSIDLAGYLDMAGGKTGALYGCALSIGAVLAGAARTAVSLLWTAGFELGLVAQIADDINGMWGDPAVTGKPVLADLLRRKRSLPVVAMVAAEERVRRRFVDLWSIQEWTDSATLEMLDVLARGGAHQFCETQADLHTRKAVELLDELGMPADVHREIHDLIHFIRHRRG